MILDGVNIPCYLSDLLPFLPDSTFSMGKIRYKNDDNNFNKTLLAKLTWSMCLESISTFFLWNGDSGHRIGKTNWTRTSQSAPGPFLPWSRPRTWRVCPQSSSRSSCSQGRDTELNIYLIVQVSKYIFCTLCLYHSCKARPSPRPVLCAIWPD